MKSVLKKYLLLLLTVQPLLHAKKETFHASFEESMEFKNGMLHDKNYAVKKSRQPIKQAREFMQFLNDLYEKNNMNMLKPREETRIPKIVHQIWIGPKTPPAVFKLSQESIKKHLPDWEYKLWTDADVESLHMQNKKYFDLSKNYGEKADIMRYEIVYQFGGVYLDIDVEVLKSFERLHHTYDFYTAILPLDCEDTLANAIIAAVPGHPILKECIDSMKDDWEGLNETLKNDDKDLSGAKIMSRSGPFHFQKAFWKAVKKDDTRCIALPKSYFFPINYNYVRKNKGNSHALTPDKVKSLIKPECIANHHWAGSWARP